MEAFVLCAGMSSRARNKKQTLSKLLLNYNNQTLLDYHIEKLRRFKIKKIYFNVFFQKKKIINIIKKKIKNVDYKIINEKKLMGTCGALQSIKNKFKKKNLLIVYPDNVSDCNYSEMILFHKKTKSDLTIATYLESDTKNSGLISFDKKNKIKFFREKKKKIFKKKMWCNAGIYILSSKIIKSLIQTDKDFGKNLFPRILSLRFNLYAYPIKKLLAFDSPNLYKKNKNIKCI